MASTHGGRIGGLAVQTSRTASPAATGVATPGYALDPRGYRHVLRPPRAAERFRIDGKSPLENRERTRELMAALAKMLLDSTENPEKLQPMENHNLPSGYTYLLQFVAHDCVQTSTPFWAVPQGQAQPRNGRISRLRLETLYGDGPGGCPIAYAPDDASDTARTRLRLGRMRAQEGVGMADGEPRDLARIAAPAVVEGPPPAPSCPFAPAAAAHSSPPLADVLIADPRNDDNALLAQMTVLFHQLHNSIIKVMGMPAERGRVAEETLIATEQRFACARAATISIYRRILREDLLRRLLHEDVYGAYCGMEVERLLDRGKDARGKARPRGFVSVPLEFSHGVGRFAHSMVRPHYTTTDDRSGQSLEQSLLQTSARMPMKMPQGLAWIVRWSNFFELPASPGRPPPVLNYSLRIAPRYTVDLTKEQLFPGEQPDDPHGVAFRDGMSAAYAGMWSVGPLYAALHDRMREKRGPDLFAQAKLFDAARREAALLAWMRAKESLAPACSDMQALAADPPLPFYILFEAEYETKGKRLGPLGSVLMAEVLFGAMIDDPLPGAQQGATLREDLDALAKALGCDGRLGRVPEINCMAEMIQFVAAVQGLDAATPPFL